MIHGGRAQGTVFRASWITSLGAGSPRSVVQFGRKNNPQTPLLLRTNSIGIPMNASLNLYGDELTVLSVNKGADIATQHADDLDQASVAYAQERPGALGTTLSWEKALLAELERQEQNEINPDIWRRWVQHWGTPQMGVAVEVVDSLFDATNTLGWRDLLLQAWRVMEAGPAEPMANLDTVVFTNA